MSEVEDPLELLERRVRGLRQCIDRSEKEQGDTWTNEFADWRLRKLGELHEAQEAVRRCKQGLMR